MAASAVYSIWHQSGYAIVNFNWQADSGGFCNSSGIIDSITGRVIGARMITNNANSGYWPYSGYGMTINTGYGLDVLRGYCASVPSSNALLTRYYNQSCMDCVLVQDSLRIAVTSAGDNRVGNFQLILQTT
jgi:hypothetical protein